MSVLKQICLVYGTGCFSKFPVYILPLNSKFHTCLPSNLRKTSMGNLEKNNMKESVCTPMIPESFGKIVALDPEKVKGYYDYTPDKTKKKRNRIDKVLHDVNNTKSSAQKEINKIHGDSDIAEKKLNFRYEHLNKYSLGSLLSYIKNKKQREKSNEILIEGKKLIIEALLSGIEAKTIFFSSVSDVEDLKLPENVKVYKTMYKELQLWSCNTTCPGIIGIFKLPPNKIVNEKNALLPVTVICDNIREPGNLGAVLRVAVGVGCKKIIFTKGCVDLWNPKVLRSGCGAHFKASFIVNAEWSDIEDEISETEEIIIANNRLPLSKEKESRQEDSNELSVSSDCCLQVMDYTTVDYKKYSSIVYIVGGETHGISSSAYQFTVRRKGKQIFIPMNNDIESLNSAVALGIILYETRRHMMGISSNKLQKKVEQL